MHNELEFAGYRPGALADVVRLHIDYYSAHWGFGLAFETKVAGELAEFLSRYDPVADLFLTVYSASGECVGSISLDCESAKGSPDGAHLRWFIVDENYAGRGVGRQLLEKVLRHGEKTGINRIWLTTFEGLHAARRLYEEHGFKLVEVRDVDQWAGGVREQLFVMQK